MTPVDHRELASLGARLLELERERSEARDHVRLLLALQTAFAEIAVTRSPDQVIFHMLRAAQDPLGFARGIFFSIDRERGVEPRWQLDGADLVASGPNSVDLRGAGAIVKALRGEAGQCVGMAEELSAPLVDTRGWYVVSALVHAETTLGLLYLDGHRLRAPRVWETTLVQALTAIAAVSLQNGLLFAQTQELAIRDPLTGLYNRRAFSSKLEEAIAEAAANGRPLTFVLIDIDDFKRLNDSFGHVHGDAVLKHLGSVLARNSRAGDVVGRYAGDEFVVVLANLEGDDARALVARLSADIRAAGLRCSLGAAVFPNDARDAAGLFCAADRALYATKAAGKNTFSFA